MVQAAVGANASARGAFLVNNVLPTTYHLLPTYPRHHTRAHQCLPTRAPALRAGVVSAYLPLPKNFQLPRSPTCLGKETQPSRRSRIAVACAMRSRRSGGLEVGEFEKKRKTVRFLESARPTSSPPDRCVRRAQEARLQSLAMQLAESDCTLRVTSASLCSADSARAKEIQH